MNFTKKMFKPVIALMMCMSFLGTAVANEVTVEDIRNARNVQIELENELTDLKNKLSSTRFKRGAAITIAVSSGLFSIMGLAYAKLPLFGKPPGFTIRTTTIIGTSAALSGASSVYFKLTGKEVEELEKTVDEKIESLRVATEIYEALLEQ